MNFLDFMRKNQHQDVNGVLIQPDSGRPMDSPTGPRLCLETIASEIDYAKKWHPMGQNNVMPDGRLHGIGIHCHYDSHGGTRARNSTGVCVIMKPDGTCNVNCGMSAHHGGPHVPVDVVAEVLGMTHDQVGVGIWGHPTATIDAGSQSGSNGTGTAGSAALNGAMEIREKLFAVAAEMLSVTPEELDARLGKIFVKADPTRFLTHAEVMDEHPTSSALMSVGLCHGPYIKRPQGDFPIGTQSDHRSALGHGWEVAVDPETGDVEILSHVNVIDAGRVIDRHHAEGQSKSGFWVQGGMCGRRWENQYDPGSGVLLSQTFLDDKLPTSMDMGEAVNNDIMLETINYTGPYGAMGIGEPAAAHYAGYMNAISNAIGVYVKERPATSMHILKLLGKA